MSNRRRPRQPYRDNTPQDRSGVTYLPPDHEPSAWLREQVSDAVATFTDTEAFPAVTVLAYIGPPARPGSREDRTCDRCRSYVPPGLPFRVFATHPKPGLILTGGLCGTCWAAEVGS